MHILRVNVFLQSKSDPSLFLSRVSGWTSDRTMAQTYETVRMAKWAAEAVGGRVLVVATLSEKDPGVRVNLPQLR